MNLLDAKLFLIVFAGLLSAACSHQGALTQKGETNQSISSVSKKISDPPREEAVVALPKGVDDLPSSDKNKTRSPTQQAPSDTNHSISNGNSRRSQARLAATPQSAKPVAEAADGLQTEGGRGDTQRSTPSPSIKKEPVKTPATLTSAPAATVAAAKKSSAKTAVKTSAEKEKPVVPLRVAMSAPVSAEETSKPVAFELEDLPITIGKNWVLNLSGDQCQLNTPPIIIDDGVSDTPIEILFLASGWVLKTKSDIDLSYTGTGLTLDQGLHFSLEEVSNETNVVFPQQTSALTQAMKRGAELQVALGFWPSWPVTETKIVQIPIRSFDLAFVAWQNCQHKLNAR